MNRLLSQRDVDQLFRRFDYAGIYLDDIVINSRTEEDHYEYLPQALEV